MFLLAQLFVLQKIKILLKVPVRVSKGNSKVKATEASTMQLWLICVYFLKIYELIFIIMFFHFCSCFKAIVNLRARASR